MQQQIEQLELDELFHSEMESGLGCLMKDDAKPAAMAQVPLYALPEGNRNDRYKYQNYDAFWRAVKADAELPCLRKVKVDQDHRQIFQLLMRFHGTGSDNHRKTQEAMIDAMENEWKTQKANGELVLKKLANGELVLKKLANKEAWKLLIRHFLEQRCCNAENCGARLRRMKDKQSMDTTTYPNKSPHDAYCKSDDRTFNKKSEAGNFCRDSDTSESGQKRCTAANTNHDYVNVPRAPEIPKLDIATATAAAIDDIDFNFLETLDMTSPRRTFWSLDVESNYGSYLQRIECCKNVRDVRNVYDEHWFQRGVLAWLAETSANEATNQEEFAKSWAQRFAENGCDERCLDLNGARKLAMMLIEQLAKMCWPKKEGQDPTVTEQEIIHDFGAHRIGNTLRIALYMDRAQAVYKMKYGNPWSLAGIHWVSKKDMTASKFWKSKVEENGAKRASIDSSLIKLRDLEGLHLADFIKDLLQPMHACWYNPEQSQHATSYGHKKKRGRADSDMTNPHCNAHDAMP